MTSHLALEYQGFLEFITRANSVLHKWFGPFCNHDPTRLFYLVSREWDGMADLERKPFIRHKVDSVSSNSHMLFHRPNKEEQDLFAESQQIFNPESVGNVAQKWKDIRVKEQFKSKTIQAQDHGIDHVIAKRDKLHKLYTPNKLCTLEFILRTRPRWPSSARLWFFRHECQGLASEVAREKWVHLSEAKRGVFERCATIDRKRYNFEKNAWITRILSIDLEADKFTLSDFDISDFQSRFESLDSIVAISEELPSLVNLRRPRNPFSLFIEAYRYQIRDERPEFQFARHLRECSEAWSKLSDEERQFYHDESRKLKEIRRALLADEPRANSRLTIPVGMFEDLKSVHGPCRPAHLYPKLPSAMSLWASEHEIPANKRSQAWKELPDELRATQERRRDDLKRSIAEQKAVIDRKHKQVKSLIREAVKLEDLKQKLQLVGATRRPIKNLSE